MNRPERRHANMEYTIITDKKKIIKRLMDLTGQKSKYLGIPSMAYQVGNYTVDSNMILSFEEDEQNVVPTLARERMILTDEVFEETKPEQVPEEPKRPEKKLVMSQSKETEVGIAVPLNQHTGNSLLRLVHLIRAHQTVLNHATLGHFAIDDDFIAWINMQDEAVYGVRNFIKAVETYEEEHGQVIQGLTVKGDLLIYSGYGDVDLHACQTLTAFINAAAINQKSASSFENRNGSDKFIFRSWLVRLGMTGPEYKEDRKQLYRHLTGYTGFPTKEKYDAWKEDAMPKILERTRKNREALRTERRRRREEAM